MKEFPCALQLCVHCLEMISDCGRFVEMIDRPGYFKIDYRSLCAPLPRLDLQLM